MGLFYSLMCSRENESFSLDVFLHCFAFFRSVCMQAMTHSVDNVPSQEQLNW